MSKKIKREILDYVGKQSIAPHFNELAEELGYSKMTIGKYIPILEAESKVVVIEKGRQKLVFLK